MSKKKNPVSNKEFYLEICKSLEIDKLTPRALELYCLTLDRLMTKLYYKNPQDAEDCRSSAIEVFLLKWYKFNPERTQNAFSYFTQMIKNGLSKGWNEINKNRVNTHSIDIFT